ncbi:protein adenylyltransferase SelO family protein [Sedimentibacter sp.]|uniref:protein adenylyltransferase SelO n=1 Tax=Sedimentibacter sp. TaxID=1960295 RepID=UPI0028B0EB6D|nr:YdiU family protein [Sedimentibacter sp.]
MSNRELKIKTGWNLDNSYARLPEIFYRKVYPTPVRSPYMIILNNDLAKLLGLNIEELNSQDGVFALAGNSVLEGSIPIAQAYAGHQFAYFTMLGDGRAILLGEQITPDNERFDIQLKGSGETPFSRRGDGRAALGPMLREYIISEAMNFLKIPTTRSLSVVETGEPVYRETVLKGAVLTRVASSHIRVGTFQYAANWGTTEDLKSLADYTINRHFPYISNDKDKYVLLLEEIVKKQASLISKWQLIGFIHGVMNTDNMAVSGETIDYGPCAFMDTYNPETVFSSIDTAGRYAYKNQPEIGEWNLLRLAEALIPILHDDEETAVKMAQDAVSKFNMLFTNNYYEGMRSKIGLFNEEQEDVSLIDDLLGLMHRYEADYTYTFNALTENKLEDTVLRGNYEFMNWYNMWQSRVLKQQKTKEEIKNLMRSSNPSVIPRNYLVEDALKEAINNEDYSVMNNLLSALSDPYSDNNEYEEYKKLPPPTTCPYRTFCGT